ncbi:coiled-coil domain-containing protein 14 isoform X2 [Hyla sarda]|uniref:coiled-coil domain-containing protein 14 isoform X2 n=1 Tax=Hyla sarda TaxID=327740 RepID=UPI0024C2C116|nr:coiled-coil domain-containing protein 14 isoform X2 [Hyla sarda]
MKRHMVVLSSGHLSLPVRPAACKKRATVRKSSATSVDSGYSLCSSDSDDQVLVINRGLDRCAELLHDILQCDVRENPQKPRTMSVSKGNVRSSTVKTKKTFVRKPSTTTSHVYKEKGSLRKTFPPRLCNAEIQRPRVSSPPLVVSSHNLDHVSTQMQHWNQVSAYSAPSAPGPEASALYNHRLPTSTPTLSPQHPAGPQSSSNQDVHQTLPLGGVIHFPSSTVASSSVYSMPGNKQAAPHNCTVPTGHRTTHRANVLSQLDHYKSLIRDSDLLQCVAAHLAQLQHSEGPLQNQAAACTAESGAETERPLTESDEASGDEDEAVREISCQTSFINRKTSPKKTEKKIKTVKYLLGEIKSLVADQGDREAMRLVAELEHSLSLLPGSTNVHAEIALALQPLRSENAQLRRRLRILNQQLRDRERVARTDEQNSEVTALQSMNETLQHQLNESQKGLETLQSKNEDLGKALEIQTEESRRAARIIQEREQEILHLKQQKDLTSANEKKEVDDAVGKMKSVQFRLEASEKENQILEITLRQRDAEVTRLRELTRTLQASMAKLLCNLGKDSAKPEAGSGLTQAALGSYDRQIQNEQSPACTSILNYLKRLETDQVFTDAMYSEKPLIPTSDSKGVNSQLTEDCMRSQSHGPKSTDPPGPPHSPHKPIGEIEGELGYVTSDEHGPDETLYLPLVSSPCKSDSSLRRMCTPPKVYSVDKNLDYRWEDNKHNSLCSSARNPGLHKVSQYTPHMLDTISEAHQQRSEASQRPPVLQPMRVLQLRDGPPTDSSRFEGRTDWSICSFSTFTSHDEQDFRNGLAALDANIAKLHKSLQSGSAKK